jgi:hypothetical protein
MQQQPSSSRHTNRQHPTRKSSSAQAAAALITDADPSLSSTSSTLLLGRSLSSSYHSSSMIETIPEDHEVFSSSSSHSHAVGHSSKRSTALPALSHRQRMDALDLSSSTSHPFVKGSGKGSNANVIQPSSSHSNLSMTRRFHNSTAVPPCRSVSSSSCFDIDTFHVGLNQCDAEALPKLRRLRESNPIVITEIDDEDDDLDEHANAKSAAAGVLPYRALQVFPGASHWWYHPYYYPTSALMRGQS